MAEKRLFADIESQPLALPVEKGLDDRAIDPLICKIYHRNLKAKHLLAKKMLSFGLPRTHVESILHIRLPDGNEDPTSMEMA